MISTTPEDSVAAELLNYLIAWRRYDLVRRFVTHPSLLLLAAEIPLEAFKYHSADMRILQDEEFLEFLLGSRKGIRVDWAPMCTEMVASLGNWDSVKSIIVTSSCADYSESWPLIRDPDAIVNTYDMRGLILSAVQQNNFDFVQWTLENGYSKMDLDIFGLLRFPQRIYRVLERFFDALSEEERRVQLLSSERQYNFFTSCSSLNFGVYISTRPKNIALLAKEALQETDPPTPYYIIQHLIQYHQVAPNQQIIERMVKAIGDRSIVFTEEVEKMLKTHRELWRGEYFRYLVEGGVSAKSLIRFVTDLPGATEV